MKFSDKILSNLSLVKRYHYRWVLILALSWTLIDILYWVHYMHAGYNKEDGLYEFVSQNAIILRTGIVFTMSILIVHLLIFKLREQFRNSPMLVYTGLRMALLFAAALVMNFLLHVTYSMFIAQKTFVHSMQRFYLHTSSSPWLVEHSIGWVILFVLSLLLIEINEKYSPGIFLQILTGRYIQPKVEQRIVLFIDMQDSTTIAEQLDSKKYFMFLRDYIYFLSLAILEYGGRIYQYVGDEIVASWKYTPENARKTVVALMHANRLFNRNRKYFMKQYGRIPEFKAGIHYGEVTVGEIGIIKKDLVMSGDTMNTAARMRSLCNEYNKKYIVSKEFVDGTKASYNLEHIGEVELKGKNNTTDLYALLI